MTKEPMKYILTFLICIIFSCQIGKSKTGMQQGKDVESTIKICIKEKMCFLGCSVRCSEKQMLKSPVKLLI